MSERKEYVYIGAYNENCDSRGIYVCEWDRTTKSLTVIGAGEGCDNPSFLAFHPSGRTLYAANEMDNAARITAYKIDRSTGLLQYLNETDTDGAGMCHLSVAPDGRSLAAACYGSGHIVSVAVREDSGIGEVLTCLRHEAHGGNPPQDKARAHQAVYDPSGGRLIAADLGADRLFVYKTGDGGRLAPADSPFAETPAGEGPRHLLFHPNGTCVWVVTELGNNLLRYVYDSVSGALAFKESVSALPDGFDGRAFAAELQLSPDARFLYVSIRGDYNRIVRFNAAADGALSHPAPFTCYGRDPRMFCFDGEGRYIFIANQSSGSVVVAHVDEKSGAISDKCCEISVPQACYVQHRIID